jgi:hypothetical protein
MLAGLPASTNYQLNSYGFGSGGVGTSSSAHYSANGLTGEVTGKGSSAHYKEGSGEANVKQADVPTIALVNSALYYHKLHMTIGPGANPSDALYAVAISTDNFVTTQYVQSDFTVGSTLNFSDYLSYAAWGGSTGITLVGLNRSTVYTVKATAYRGKYTQSAYGPTASAATVDPSLSFEIDVSAIDTTTSPPYLVNFGTLPVSTITSSPVRVWVSLDTNADSGGSVFVSGQNTGLKSAAANYTIASTTGDLAALSEGFGAQGASATQSSGGPLALQAPYNGSAGNVGVTDSLIREIFNAPAPITAGRGSFVLKAKTQPLTPSSGDYTEILTAIASASF